MINGARFTPLTNHVSYSKWDDPLSTTLVKPPPKENWDEKGEVETAPNVSGDQNQQFFLDRTLQMPLQKKLVTAKNAFWVFV